MAGLWVSPGKYIEFEERQSARGLHREIVSRNTAWDYSGTLGLLPDPDPILAKRGDGAEILESLTSDGHLLSVIQTRKLGTLKREHRWEPGTDEDGEATKAAKDLCDELKADFAGIEMFDLLSALLDAPLYGMAPAELLWGPRDGQVRLSGVRALPNRWFAFDEDNAPRFRSLSSSFTGEALPWGKFVFARHFPTYDNPYGLRLLSRCFWPVVFKKGGTKFWVTFTEKYGMPFLLGKYARGATEEEQNRMLASLERMVQDAVAVVPDGNVVEMLGGTGTTSGSHEAFDRLRLAMDAEMSKVIVGQTLTAEVGVTGSYAAAKVHDDVLDDYRQADQGMIKTVMERIARIYRDLNAPGVPAPVWTWFEEDDPQTEFAERDKTLTESGRVRLSKAYYMRRYGYHEEEIEVVDQAAPALPPDRSAAFAEGAPRFTPEQQALEDLADQALAQVDLSGNEELIVAAVESADSYEQAMENLMALYPQLNLDDLQEMMERTMLAAEMFGRLQGGTDAG